MKTRILTLLLLALLAPVAAQAQFGGGDGTSDNPYIIATTDHWLELANSVKYGNAHGMDYFKLTADLDFSGIDFIPIGGDFYGVTYTHFDGTFDGGYHRILNVRMGCNRFAGLFGYFIGEVRNLTLGGNSRIEGEQYVGGIVGMSDGGLISNCHVEKTVTIAANNHNSKYIGGIVGLVEANNAPLEREIVHYCTNAATVTNNGKSYVRYVGGIAGGYSSREDRCSPMERCTNYGAVSGHEYVGGVVGFFSGVENALIDCYTGVNCTLFGVGQEGSTQGINLPNRAASMHTITFGENVQGRANTIHTATFEGNRFYGAGSQITLSLHSDKVPEGYYQHRFDINGELHNSGDDIKFTMPAEDVTITVGDLLRDIAYSPWVSVVLSPESFEYDGSVHIPDVIVTDIKDGNSVTLTEGIDYEVVGRVNHFQPKTYKIYIRGLGNFGGEVEAQYSITPPLGNWIGDGTAESPYLIYTTSDWKALADSVNGGNSYEGQFFSLQNDLRDIPNVEIPPIGNGSQSFKGTFNGNGHTIGFGVTSTNVDYCALFGWIGEGGVVSGLNLDTPIEGPNCNYVGGIAAMCEGTVIDCSTNEWVQVFGRTNSTAGAAGASATGGIVAKLTSTGRVVNCQNRARNVLSDVNYCGGIVGVMEGGEVVGCINYGSVAGGKYYGGGGIVGVVRANGIVAGCVNEGSVSGNQVIGGIVGSFAQSSISDCLNLGVVSGSFNWYVGGIAGQKDVAGGSASNNYYAGACSVGGIEGSDVAGQAMRGYAVSVAPANLGAKTAENSFMPAYENGLFYNGKYYVGSIGLYDAAANDELIAEMADICTNLSITVPVVLQGRTLYKTGIWNTICLPFALSSFAGTPLADATVKELVSSGYNASTGTLTLNFETVSAIEAGKPYIVRWNGGESLTDVTDPVFNGVTISDVAAGATETQYTDFIGLYSSIYIGGLDRTMLYLGGDSKLYYPNDEMQINAFRGYFRLKEGLRAGDRPGTTEAKKFVVNLGGDVPTGVNQVDGGELANDSWYTIDGVKLNGEPRKKGVYIYNGKKVVK